MEVGQILASGNLRHDKKKSKRYLGPQRRGVKDHQFHKIAMTKRLLTLPKLSLYILSLHAKFQANSSKNSEVMHVFHS